MSVNHEQLDQDALLQINATTAHAQLDGIAQQAAANASSRLVCTSRAFPGSSA